MQQHRDQTGPLCHVHQHSSDPQDWPQPPPRNARMQHFTGAASERIKDFTAACACQDAEHVALDWGPLQGHLTMRFCNTLEHALL